jgi:oligopeptidase B
MRDHSDPEVLAYLDAERAAYDRATAHLRGVRESIGASLRRRLAEVEADCPWQCGPWTYQRRYDVGADYPSYVRWSADDQDVHPVVDIGAVVGDADFAEVGLFEPSDDGGLLAYSVDCAGDEVYELRFRDLETGVDLPDRIERSYYGGAWSSDGSAFYYTVHDEAYRPHQVWRHRLGTPVAQDELVLHEDDRRFEVELRRSRSGAFVLVSATSRTTRQEWAIDAALPRGDLRAVRDRVAGVEDTVEHVSGADGGRWLVVTNQRCPEFSLLGASVADWSAGRAEWTEDVAGRDGWRLATCDAFAGSVVLGWRHGARPVLQVWSLGPSGRLGTEPAATIAADVPAGTVLLGPNGRYDAAGVVVEQTSLVHPSVWWFVPFDGGPRRVVHRAAAPGHDPQAYVTRAMVIEARDGIPVPVTLAYAPQTPLDGTAPGLIWAYGAYESCDWPVFDPTLPEWLDRGVVYALAHVRGGGEGGRTWWDQGHLEAKHHTFTDLIDVADALVARQVMAPDRVATRGLSAGGLLQGAVFAMRPDRWRIIVAEVPFVDCVTSMLDDSIPLTVNEWEEWGDPRRAADYRWMRAYTPYENIPRDPWPLLLVTGSLHDPRVLVHEPAKWVAKLRTLQAEDAVVLFRAETGPGAHTGPAGRWAHADYEAEIMAVVLDAILTAG